MKKTQRIIGLLMAMVMILSMGIVSFAQETQPDNTKVKVIFNLTQNDGSTSPKSLGLKLVSGNGVETVVPDTATTDGMMLPRGKEYKISYNTGAKLLFLRILDNDLDTTKATFKTANQDTMKLDIGFGFENINSKLTVNYEKSVAASKMLLNGSEVSNLSSGVSMKQGVYNLEFTGIPEGYKVVEKYGSINKDSVFKVSDNLYKVSLSKDTSLSFITIKEDATFDVNPFTEKATSITGRTFKYSSVVALVETGNSAYYAGSVVADENGNYTVKLPQAIKTNDKVTIYSKSHGGGFYTKEFSYKPIERVLPLSLKTIKTDAKEVTGITEPMATVKVWIDGSEKEITGRADSEGKFSVVTQALVKEKEVKVQSSLGDNKYSNFVYGIVGKEIGSVERFAGNSRYDTALDIAVKHFARPSYVVLVSGEKTADALAAGPFAGALKAPILLSSKAVINDNVLDYIKTKLPQKVYIVGGEGSVDKNIEAKIKGHTSVERISGDNRYATSLEVAKQLRANFGFTGGVILANGGEKYDADALAVAPYAMEKKYPIVLVDGKAIPAEVSKQLKDWNIISTTVVGGQSTVPSSVVEKGGLRVAARLSGENRYETSLTVAKALQSYPQAAIIANGNSGKSVDALASAPLAIQKQGVILLTDGTSLITPTHNYIKNNMIETIYITGGTSSVSQTIQQLLSGSGFN